MSRAFLFGAGVTKAEYPQAPLTNDFFSILQGRNYSLFDAIRKASGIQHLRNENIETVMDMSDQFSPSAKSVFLESVHSAIYELLAEPTQSTRQFIDSYTAGQYVKPPTLLKALLNDARLSTDDFFMTLNYDLYLDREVIMIQGMIDYGIKSEHLAYSQSSESFPLLNKPLFSVYHLHGALSWEIGGGKISTHRGAVRPKYTRTGSSLCLMPPGKKELHPILKPIWQTAEERLLKADELIIIGCSLNPKDKELIDVLKKGPNKIKIIYLDPQLSKSEHTTIEENAYHANLGKRFKSYPYGFNLLGPGNGQGAIEFIFS